MIVVKGNIFSSQMQTLTNPVNCIGVAGAGLAKSFATRYPEFVPVYQAHCRTGALRVGRPTTCYTNDERMLLLFPTKDHWKQPSKMAYVEKGLHYLKEHWRDLGIESLAVPLLGAGLGGLPRDQVQGLITRELKGLPIPVEVYV